MIKSALKHKWFIAVSAGYLLRSGAHYRGHE